MLEVALVVLNVAFSVGCGWPLSSILGFCAAVVLVAVVVKVVLTVRVANYLIRWTSRSGAHAQG